MLIFSLVGSIVLLLIIACLAWGKPTVQGWGIVVVPLLGVFVGWPCVLFPVLALNSLVLCLVGAVCLKTKTRLATFLYCCLGATALSYLSVVGFTIPWWLGLAALRREYPYESIAERLAYETKRRDSHAGPDQTAQPPKPEEREARMARYDGTPTDPLTSLEEDMGLSNVWRRRFALEQLHEDVVGQFINAPGFGVSRAPLLIERRIIELPDVEPVALPTPAVSELSAAAEEPPSAGDSGGGLVNDSGPDVRALKKLLNSSILDFSNPEGFGYVRDRDHVAGFQQHRFRTRPEAVRSQEGAAGWEITRLELVSLLKHEEPGVYLSEHLPRMDELRDAPVRPLNTFERSALKDLESGKDLKALSGGDTILMLGSIGAIKYCLDCHDAQRGDLLGAFSYRLRRNRSEAATPLSRQ